MIRLRMRSTSFHSRFYLDAMLADHLQLPLKSLSKGSTAVSLQASQLSALRLIAPTSSEQRMMAEFPDAACRPMNGLGATTATAIERLAAYRQPLIPFGITGKINVREPA